MSIVVRLCSWKFLDHGGWMNDIKSQISSNIVKINKKLSSNNARKWARFNRIDKTEFFQAFGRWVYVISWPKISKDKVKHLTMKKNSQNRERSKKKWNKNDINRNARTRKNHFFSFNVIPS